MIRIVNLLETNLYLGPNVAHIDKKAVFSPKYFFVDFFNDIFKSIGC